MMKRNVDTPCIAICSTALGDQVCRGCARTFQEITQWCSLSDLEKDTIWARLPDRQEWLKVAREAGVLLDTVLFAGREWGVLQRADGDGVLFRRNEQRKFEVAFANGQRQVLEQDFVTPAEVAHTLLALADSRGESV